jgi:cobalt/nickel transport system permease protein
MLLAPSSAPLLDRESKEVGERKWYALGMFLALHIPDGFLVFRVSAAGWIVTAIVIAVALRITARDMGERQVPMMGLMGAFIFAAQAINFPIAGGTSGHLLGAALAAIVLGPWAAALVMACVIGLQGLVFGDGGLLTMGWNIFNMGILAAFVADATVRGLGFLPRSVAVLLAAWLSVLAGATATSLELAASGTSPLAIVLPAMVGVHVLMGLGEGVVTAAAVAWVARVRPEAVERKGGSALGWGLLAVLVVCLAAPLASTSPDGLDRIARQQGFHPLEQPRNALLPDYTFPMLGRTPLSTILAMVFGAALLCGLCSGLGRLVTRRRSM